MIKELQAKYKGYSKMALIFEIAKIRKDTIEECIDAIAYCVSASECDEVLNELKEQK